MLVNEFRHLLVGLDEGTLQITINRPEVRNALAWETLEELRAAIAHGADDSVRGIVITGGKQTFCAGADLKTATERRTEGVTAPVARLRLVQQLLLEIEDSTKPVIAAVEGAAFGIGWALALACDGVIASTSSRFGSPFLARGLVPDGGVIWWLTRELGTRATMRILLGNAVLSASEALEARLVTALADEGTALEVALAETREICAGPPDAIGLTKRLVRRARDMSLSEFLDLEWLAAGLNLTGADAAEGIRAFVEKRDAQFRAVGDRGYDE